MSKGNGEIHDQGLLAIKAAFDGAQYLNSDAFDAASLMILGKHREFEIPDNAIMEIYGTLTEGKKTQFSFTNESGDGYIVNIESYTDLVAFMQGTLPAHVITQGAEPG